MDTSPERGLIALGESVGSAKRKEIVVVRVFQERGGELSRQAPCPFRLWRALEWIDWFWYPFGLKQRIVWDFESNKEIVSWRPNSATVIPDSNPNGRSLPYPFAISPDGKYIVEGGGRITLYRIDE